MADENLFCPCYIYNFLKGLFPVFHCSYKDGMREKNALPTDHHYPHSANKKYFVLVCRVGIMMVSRESGIFFLISSAPIACIYYNS